MEDIFALSDLMICNKIGATLKQTRLKQNITQQECAKAANISLSSLKNIEKGEIRSFDSLLRVMRILGKLDILQPLVEDEQLSPSEYYEMVHAAKQHQRLRATKQNMNTQSNNREDEQW